MTNKVKNEDSKLWFTKLIGSLFIGGVLLWGGIFLFAENQNNSITSSSECTRNEAYSIPPEFIRALSLINQRLYGSNEIYSTLFAFNCLNISYADTHSTNAEGYFYFDPESPANNLKINVDSSYQLYDDYLTAIFLHMN